jgi:hypothetical protein
MHQERLPAHLVARVRMHACTRWPPGRDEHFKRRPSGETSNSSRDISQEGVRGMREPETARTTGKDAEARGNSACRSGGVNNRGWRTPALELSDVGQIRSASNRACQCPALHLAHRRSHGRLCVCARVWPQVCGHRYANPEKPATTRVWPQVRIRVCTRVWPREWMGPLGACVRHQPPFLSALS